MTQEQYDLVREAERLTPRAARSKNQEAIFALLEAFEALYWGLDSALEDVPDAQEHLLFDDEGFRKLQVRK